MLKQATVLFSSLLVSAAFAATAPVKATAQLVDASGAEVGKIDFREATEGVEMDVHVTKGLSAGKHGIHIHEKGVCDAPKFAGAGGHFNPNKHQHGLSNPSGPHAGDLPTIDVTSKDGSVDTKVISKGVSLGKGLNSLLQDAGTAVVIHAKDDDQKTDPSGNSGDRAVCGVIKAAMVQTKTK